MSAVENAQSLSDKYKMALRLLDDLDKSESTSSDEAQLIISQGIKVCEEAVKMVNELSLYSSNESFEEMPTADVKYLLLPAFMGYFTGMGLKETRQGLLQKSKVYFKHFLKLCAEYSVPEVPRLPEETEEPEMGDASSVQPAGGHGGLGGAASTRSVKLARFREQQQTKQQLAALERYVQQDHVDDETQRKYYQTLLKRWGLTAQEQLDAIDQELAVLEYMKQRGAGHPVPEKPKTKAPQTFILTRSAAQKAVFGLGYPSLPTYTVEEWYDQQVAAGNMPAPGTAPAPHMPTPEEEAEMEEQRKAEDERKEEVDDEDFRRKQREWDEHTDEHRRGSGNTKGKG